MLVLITSQVHQRSQSYHAADLYLEVECSEDYIYYIYIHSSTAVMIKPSRLFKRSIVYSPETLKMVEEGMSKFHTSFATSYNVFLYCVPILGHFMSHSHAK